jgi:hypothetical protein
MSDISIQPGIMNVKKALKGTGLSVNVQVDQPQRIYGAILGMQEKAAEGLQKAAERAEPKVRRLYIDILRSASGLSERRVERGVNVRVTAKTASATESFFKSWSDPWIPAAPRVGISVTFGRSRIPLDNYPHEQTADGIGRIGPIRRDYPGAFEVRGRVYRRVGRERAPISHVFGPSIRGVAGEASQAIESANVQARDILFSEVLKVRDEIVTEFLQEGQSAARKYIGGVLDVLENPLESFFAGPIKRL